MTKRDGGLLNSEAAMATFPTAMLLLDQSPIPAQIMALSSEIISELSEIGSFFNEFFVQKKHSLSLSLAAYSQQISENSSDGQVILIP